MKRIIQTLLIFPCAVWGQTCPTENAQQAQYQLQQKWKPVDIQQPGVMGSVQGYVDANNNFYPVSLTRNQKMNAQLFVEKTNPDFASFLSSCKDFGGEAKYLEENRIAKRGNKYTAFVKYLPDVTGFKNNPFKDIKTNSFELEIKYLADSLVENSYRARTVQENIYANLYKQIQSSSIGSYTLDLTNLDDFACDLIQGKASLSVYRRMDSPAIQVTRTENISLESTLSLYEQWTSTMASPMDAKELYYRAGSLYESLNASGLIENVDLKTSLDLLKKITNDQTQSLNKLGMNELVCLNETLQTYRRNLEKHLINIDFTFDSLSFFNQGNN